jgi:hypothetical protein
MTMTAAESLRSLIAQPDRIEHWPLARLGNYAACSPSLNAASVIWRSRLA